MSASITKYILLIIILGFAQIGIAQSVFNKAFDEGNVSNTTPNALEAFGSYSFVQKIFKNGSTHLEAVIIDTFGTVLQKGEIVTDSSLNIYYGYPGSLQMLSTQELCQLYHTALDSGVNLVFFDDNLNVTQDIHYDFNFFLNAGVIKQINDSTLITLGRIQNSSTFDLFLINTDLQGNERWRTIFGESGKDDYGFAIEFVNNKILVGGQTYYTSQVAHPHIFEFNTTGQLLFDTTYTQYDNGGEIMYSNLHGLYQFCSRNNYPTSVYPILLKINSDYSILWSKEYFKNEQFVAPGNVTMSIDGLITIAGTFQVNGLNTGLFFQANHNGDSITTKLIDHIPGERAQFHDIRPTSDGGYIMAGETRAPSQDSWIVKVNSWGCDNIPCIVSVPEELENNARLLICYPNPSNGLGMVKGSFETAGIKNEIKVFNSLGQLVFSKIIATKEFKMEISLPNNGLYLVNLYEGNELVKSLKWVVR